MDCFYDKTFFTTTLVEEKIHMQVIKKYVKSDSFDCDIQPMDEKTIKYVFGEDIKSRLQMYCDENLNVDDVIIYNNSSYRIEKKIPWDDYYLYALMEWDCEVLNNDSTR